MKLNSFEDSIQNNLIIYLGKDIFRLVGEIQKRLLGDSLAPISLINLFLQYHSILELKEVDTARKVTN